MVAQNPIIHGNDDIYMHSDTFKYFSHSVTDFFLSSTENTKKWAIFYILMAITPGVRMITRRMTPFSSSTFWVLPICIFQVSISKPSKFQFHGVHILHYVLVCKKQFIAKDDTFKLVNIDILFFYTKFANFWYITYSVSNLIPI